MWLIDPSPPSLTPLIVRLVSHGGEGNSRYKLVGKGGEGVTRPLASTHKISFFVQKLCQVFFAKYSQKKLNKNTKINLACVLMNQPLVVYVKYANIQKPTM